MSKIKIFALGGLNEPSKNMYVVEIDEDIFVFEAGLKYADDKFLGVDYIIPDYSYIKNNINRVRGIFLSHAHSEQIGAIKNMAIDFATLFMLLMVALSTACGIASIIRNNLR